MLTGQPTVKLIRVFVSSPGDVNEERAVLDEVIDRINRTQGQETAVRLVTWKWEDDVVPQIGPKAQDVVDAQTPSYDVYLGIMAHRFGSPTGRYGSGTEKEFRDALKYWGKVGSPWILFYFSEAKVDPFKLDAEQLAKVAHFRKEVQKNGLYATYDGVRGAKTAFFEQVDEHLRKLIPLLSAATDTEKPQATNKEQPARPSIPQHYLDWLQRQCADIDLPGLRLKEGRSPRLDHVYVPLNTQSKSLLDLFGRRSLYVSAGPGAGKSTFCRWVAWLACEKSLSTSEPREYSETIPSWFADLFPVLVSLRDFWSFLPQEDRADLSLSCFEESLSAWIANKKPPGLTWSNVEQHLHQGTALVIFDGVDEVPISRNDGRRKWHPRSLLISGLVEAMSEWCERVSYNDRHGSQVPPPNRLLVTSRPYGLRESDLRKLQLHHAEIDDLSQPLQDSLVRRWFSILSKDTRNGSELANRMFAHLRGRREIEDLTANPLLLTAMCIVYYEGKRLPQDRCDLYDRIVDTVLYNRFRDAIKVELVRNELGVVAHTMHTGFHLAEQRTTPQVQVTYDEIDRTLEAYREKLRWTQAGFEDVVTAREHLLSQTGLLLARSENSAEFYHLSIQEFLAAERLWLQSDLANVFLERSEFANWRNTLSFLFGTLLNKRSEPDHSITLLEVLIEQCRVDQRGLLLVIGDCIEVLKGKGIRLAPEKYDQYRQKCVDAIKHESRLDQLHEWCLELGRTGDPRIVSDLRDESAYVEISAGTYPYQNETCEIKKSFLLSHYPVTNGQYAVFIDQEGYQRREFWSDEGWKWLGSDPQIEPRYWRDGELNIPNQPVVGVSYWEAEAFCNWAGGQLPNQEQWEAAARGPSGPRYPWGNHWEKGICNSHELGLEVTTPVGLFPRSSSLAFGLEEMSGNVWEWCQDLHGCDGHVMRGGSFCYEADACQCTFRGWHVSTNRHYSHGFRVLKICD